MTRAKKRLGTVSATVHPGSLGRWFEELCRITVPQLEKIATKSQDRVRPKVLPDCGGVYVFWWTGDTGTLRQAVRNRRIILKGPRGRHVALRVNDEWLGLESELPVPLYVGKTIAGIRGRIVKHLRLTTKRMLPTGRGAEKAKPPTTTCQLRAGIEHFFPNDPDTRKIVLGQVGLSFVELDGDAHAANRFYLEELAIGLMRPPFNVGVEH